MSCNKPMGEFPLLKESEGVPLFYPHVPKDASSLVSETLSGRWIGQGPKVDLFEKRFVDVMQISGFPLAVSSGTAALHLAYALSGVGRDDEVICPVFTCTATNLPIIYLGAKPIFADVAQGELNIDIDSLESLITPKTKAISVVDYGGKPNDYQRLRSLCDKYNLSLIADCAHAIDGKLNDEHVSTYADFTMFSFQAIKTLTTGDGGMLIINDETLLEKGRRLRWFGIDRSEKQKGTWENDIYELGYKYQMTDIAASIGLAGLETINDVLGQRRRLAEIYFGRLTSAGVHVFESYGVDDKDFTPWMITIDTRGKRDEVMNHLRTMGIESAQVHYRNDRYTVFGDVDRSRFPNMNSLEDNYLVLPLHTKMNESDVSRAAEGVLSVMA